MIVRVTLKFVGGNIFLALAAVTVFLLLFYSSGNHQDEWESCKPRRGRKYDDVHLAERVAET